MKLRNLATVTAMELKRVWNDKRLVFILTAGPVVVCSVFGFIAYKSPQELDVTVYLDDFHMTQAVEIQQVDDIINNIDMSDTFSVVRSASLEEAMRRMDEGLTRAVIVIKEGNDRIESVTVTIDATDPTISYAVASELPVFFEQYSTSMSIQSLNTFGFSEEQSEKLLSPFTMTFETNEWRELKYFDFYASALVILLALCLPLGLASPAITSERALGTIERIFVSPYRRSEIIIGKMLAHTIFAVIIIILVLITLKLLFDITLGNIALVLLVSILVGINAVILGLLISSITYSESESILLAIMCFLGLLLQMTYLIPWESMHVISRYISYAIPYTYGVQAIRSINLVGAGFADIWRDLIIMFGFIVIQALIATQLLKREIK
jgi:ABC-2 type transport system permease protein